MGTQDVPTREQLIQLLEDEARRDIHEIDVASDQEAQITLPRVQQWYLEAEKLIRVLANVLPSTMAQPINQLRYAGHHVLKAATVADTDPRHQANVVEAFKHCKRAYYDSIDLYIFHMAESHRDKLAFLPDPEQTKALARELEEVLERVSRAREEAMSRIEYYDTVRAGFLLDGLRLISRVNQAMAESGITDQVVRERRELAQENLLLREQVERKLDIGAARFNRWMLVMTVVIVLATTAGLIFQGAGTTLFLSECEAGETTPDEAP